MEFPSFKRPAVNSAAAAVVGFTALLTASFVGVVSLIEGGEPGMSGRVPFYVLAMAIVFVTSLWIFERWDLDGRWVLTAVAGISILSFALLSLAGEGVVFTVNHPNRVLTPDVLLYFVAAALICTGLGIWGVKHWQEFTGDEPSAVPKPEE